MKKIKKIIIPLIVVLCIPLFLAGCGSKEAFAASSQNKDGEIWYAVSSKNTVDSILYVKGNEITNYSAGNHSLNYFTSKSSKQILKLARKATVDSDNVVDTNKFEAKLITDDNNKVLKEKIYTLDEDHNKLCTLESPTATVNSNGKKYYGYKFKSDGEQYKLISNSGKQVAFDNDKTNNVEQVNQEND